LLRLNANGGGREIRQSIQIDPLSGRAYVVRVVVEPSAGSVTVVTAYRSSRISRSWRQG
jgi:hypothetical protein